MQKRATANPDIRRLGGCCLQPPILEGYLQPLILEEAPREMQKRATANPSNLDISRLSSTNLGRRVSPTSQLGILVSVGWEACLHPPTQKTKLNLTTLATLITLSINLRRVSQPLILEESSSPFTLTTYLNLITSLK